MITMPVAKFMVLIARSERLFLPPLLIEQSRQADTEQQKNQDNMSIHPSTVHHIIGSSHDRKFTQSQYGLVDGMYMSVSCTFY